LHPFCGEFISEHCEIIFVCPEISGGGGLFVYILAVLRPTHFLLLGG